MSATNPTGTLTGAFLYRFLAWRPFAPSAPTLPIDSTETETDSHPFDDEPSHPTTDPTDQDSVTSSAYYSPMKTPAKEKDDDDEITVQAVVSPWTILQRRLQAAEADGLVMEIEDNEPSHPRTASTFRDHVDKSSTKHLGLDEPSSPAMDEKAEQDEIFVEAVLSPETVLQRRYRAAMAEGLVIELVDSDDDENDENKPTTKQTAVVTKQQLTTKAPPRPQRTKTTYKTPASPTTPVAGSILRRGLRRSARLNKNK